jgi:hypothetical protein
MIFLENFKPKKFRGGIDEKAFGLIPLSWKEANVVTSSISGRYNHLNASVFCSLLSSQSSQSTVRSEFDPPRRPKKEGRFTHILRTPQD